MNRMIVAATALLFAACQNTIVPAPSADAGAAAVAPILDTPDAVDVHSFAKPIDARVTHVALDLAVDFNSRRIGGTATLDIQAKPNATSIVLDDKGLEIAGIKSADGTPLTYTVGSVDPNLGAPLTVAIGAARKIVITYKSAPDAGALQWLTPEQTVGKKQPFLFSQGESIENRSWIRPRICPAFAKAGKQKYASPNRLPQ